MSDRQIRIVLSTAVAVGAATAAGLVYLYRKKRDEAIPTRWKKVGEISDLNFFPVKSCAPIKRQSMNCHQLGIEYENFFDRGFIIVRNNKQATGRAYPKIVLIQPKIDGDKLILSAPNCFDFVLNVAELRGKSINEKVRCNYSDVCAIDAGDEVADWLSEYIVGRSGVFRLFFYPHLYPTKEKPEKDRKYKAFKSDDVGTYHNKTSYMLINQASVDDINIHLDHVVEPLQYRPNFVVKGAKAFDEDHWNWIRIGDTTIFRYVKPCTRCTFTLVNPKNGTRNAERQPYKTLMEMRTMEKGDKPYMGIQLGIRVTGQVHIGDAVYVNDNDE